MKKYYTMEQKDAEKLAEVVISLLGKTFSEETFVKGEAGKKPEDDAFTIIPFTKEDGLNSYSGICITLSTIPINNASTHSGVIETAHKEKENVKNDVYSFLKKQCQRVGLSTIKRPIEMHGQNDYGINFTYHDHDAFYIVGATDNNAIKKLESS